MLAIGFFETLIVFCIDYWKPHRFWERVGLLHLQLPQATTPNTIASHNCIKLHQNAAHSVHLDTLSLHLSLLSPIFPSDTVPSLPSPNHLALFQQDWGIAWNQEDDSVGSVTECSNPIWTENKASKRQGKTGPRWAAPQQPTMGGT